MVSFEGRYAGVGSPEQTEIHKLLIWTTNGAFYHGHAGVVKSLLRAIFFDFEGITRKQDLIWNINGLLMDRPPISEKKSMKNLKTIPSHLAVYAVLGNAVIVGALTFGPCSMRPVLGQTTVAITAPVPSSDPAAREINAFQDADKKQMPPAGAVLFLGSSSIRLWTTLAQDFPEIPVINRGFGGSLVQDSTHFADRIVIPYNPKIIVFFAGTNDLAYGNKKPQQVLQDYEDFVAKIHAALPDTRIVYISINPTVARWSQEAEVLETNHLIEEFVFEANSKTEKLNFINSHSQLLTADGLPQPNLLRKDGLHLNTKGYKVWTAIVKPRIMALAAIDGVERLDGATTSPMPQ